LRSPAVESDEGSSFCSTGCRDVQVTLGVADTPEGDTIQIAGDTDSVTERASTDGSTESSTDGGSRTFFGIDGMYSATCESFLESVASGHDGVIDAEASYVTETIRVDYDADQVSKSELREALDTLGYSAYLRESGFDALQESVPTRRSQETTGGQERPDDNILEFRYAVGFLFGTFLMMPYVAIVYPANLASIFNWGFLEIFEGSFQLSGAGAVFFLRLYLVLSGIILVFTGLPVLRGAYISLKMRRPNSDLLVAITVMSAYAYSTLATLLGRSDIFFDITIVVAAAVTAAMFYESAIKQRALGRLTELTVSQVNTAEIYDSEGTTKEVGVEELTSGDRVLVRQGERIPVDGELIEGTCTVDEAVVTGESLPVLKQTGDDVIGGSIVTDDAAVVQVGENATSSIDRITTAVWNLQSADHGVQRHADQLASRIVGLVGGIALLVSIGAVVFGLGGLEATRLFLLVLLVGSPWALGLATPLSVATSLKEALRRGIVVFDETVFERLRDIDIVVFDKTGTLTTGEMDVIEADAPTDLLEMAAELENRASHPAAKAIATAFASEVGETVSPRSDGGRNTERDIEQSRTVSEFTSYASGIEGVVDGREILVGNLDLFAEQGWEVSEDIESRASDARGFGRLPVIVGRDGEAEGIIIVGDEPRSGWDDVVTRLGKQGTKIVVLTGDDEEAADFFSQHDSVTHVFADVPPEGKTATIRRLKSDGQVAMVGDGTNDAPALAAAHLGITLGSGTALAADAADIAIADDKISSVEIAFDIASAARRRVRQNNRLALVYNGMAVSAVALGVFNSLAAAVAVITSGGLIAANSSRALVE
jgi:heavy metal translocating P-type ATPase